MKKRAISISLALAMLFVLTLATAADTNVVDSMEFQGKGIELTLNDAIQIMLKDNPTLLKSSLDLEQAKVSYDKNSSTLRKIRKSFNIRDVGSLDYLQSVTLFELSTEYGINNAQRTYDATLEGLKASIEESYYGLLQAEQLKKINEENMLLSRDLYDKIKKKYELGLAAKQEVLNSELSYIKAQNGFRAAENAVKSAKMAFNAKLGYDIMTEVKLKDELKYKEFELGSIAEAVKKALQSRMEIKSLEYAHQVADINMKIADIKFDDFMYPYKEAKINLQKAQRDLENVRKNIEMEVRINYMDVLQKQQEIKAGEKSVTLAEEALKISQVSYDAGMGLMTDVQKAQVALQQAKLGLSKAILDYNLAVLKFEDSIGVGRK